jgi:rubredoxin
MVWECQACSYVYCVKTGDPAFGVASGTDFEDVPDTWRCPVCGVGKEFFEEITRHAD